MLMDQVFTNARITPKTKNVCLWLGANVMLEYPLPEAEELLLKNRTLAEDKLTQIETDLEFLRSQITTTEVNMARVFNWDVQRRKPEEKNAAAVTASS
jgi:prefoldin subunit 5